jgi:class 3 adenylate cyclase/tetratricopeptide (TPR) repeat protein
MRCARCGADNPSGMNFCGRCGAALGLACPSCGASNPPEPRFCGHCGARLSGPGLQEGAAPEPYLSKPQTKPLSAGPASTLPGEIKQVTVLFCDIVNSTPMTERLGPEAMRDLVHAFLEASLAEVRRYGGSAPQFTGDGFLAVFGAPISQEDHVRRALLAALAIRHAVSGSANRAGVDLLVRIGVHTGPVVFGPVANNLAMDYTVIGDTANVAARLQAAAEPGTTLISETTHLFSQSYTRVEPVGPLALKGKADPLAAYRLFDVSHRRSGLREWAQPRTAHFVNRASELAILNSVLRQVENGGRQVVGLVGEAGIGKSRLVAEFHDQLASDRVSWVEGRCLSYGTGIPYLLALGLLRSACGIAETDTAETITEKVCVGLSEAGMDPEEDGRVLLNLLEVGNAAGSPILSNPEAIKRKSFEVLRQLNIKASERRPLVLVIEDLHWVDKISEEFLGFLTENSRNARLLLLASYRPGYHPPWIDKSYAAQTPLPPLSRDDSVQMVRSVLRAERLLDLITEEIVAKADGNPFFLEQLALHAGEARGGRTDLMVPDTIHDVVMARVDRLPDAAKRLLQIAAVIGREFPLRLLSAVWQDPEPLEEQLRELNRLEFIYELVETEGSVYVFRHALTQETAYGSLLERHRRAHHGAIGRALEGFHSERPEEVVELLALHFGRSDEAEKSVDYAIWAGEKAQHRWANSKALDYFNDALHRLELLPDTEANRLRRIDAVLKQGDGKFALGEHAEHIQALDKIRSLVDQIDDPRRRATWHYWRGWTHIMTGGHPDIAINDCNQATELATAAGLDDIKAYAESCLAQVYLTAGRLREALEAGERALAHFDVLGNLWWAVRTISHLSPVAIALGEWDKSLNYCRRAIEHGITLDDTRLRVIGLWRMGVTYAQQGDPERGIKCCDEALALQPLPYDAATAKWGRGYAEIKAGRFDAGIADLREALVWLDKAHLSYPRWRASLYLAEGYLRSGDRVAARPLIEEILEPSRATGYLHFEGLACWLMGECLAPDDPVSAEPYVTTATAILGRVGARNDLGRAMMTRAALRQAAGDVATARQLIDQAAAIFRTLGTLDEAARVEVARAALGRGSPIALLVTAG